mmetsp:Transcript_69496/g.137446  ORF Transcript_69496/g.137446 Transcript_69496/m.137446 type:complete len:209 (+) Transcript_69496:1508-2134(+)
MNREPPTVTAVEQKPRGWPSISFRMPTARGTSPEQAHDRVHLNGVSGLSLGMSSGRQRVGMSGGRLGLRMRGGRQGLGMSGGRQGLGTSGGMQGLGMRGGMKGPEMSGGNQGLVGMSGGRRGLARASAEQHLVWTVDLNASHHHQLPDSRSLFDSHKEHGCDHQRHHGGSLNHLPVGSGSQHDGDLVQICKHSLRSTARVLEQGNLFL